MEITKVSVRIEHNPATSKWRVTLYLDDKFFSASPHGEFDTMDEALQDKRMAVLALSMAAAEYGIVVLPIHENPGSAH